MLTCPTDNGLFNAALTDNGGQVCSMTNLDVGYNGGPVVYIISLNCIGGYSAKFHSETGLVEYAYPGYSSSFGTSSYTTNGAVYYTADVWGC